MSTYQKYFLGGKDGRCVGLTTLSLSCDDCLEIREPQPPGTLRACPGLKWDCFTLLVHVVIFIYLQMQLKIVLGYSYTDDMIFITQFLK